MLFIRVMFVDEKKNLYVYKLPDSLNKYQIDWYFSEYLKLKGSWKYVNDVKIHRRLSVTKYNSLFASKDFNNDIYLIKEYFLKHNSRDALWVQMRAFGCKYLYSKGMIMSDIAEIMNYKNHTSIIYNIKTYKNFTDQLKYEDFMKIIKRGDYPFLKENNVEFIKLK